jgi:hypothetical protein
MSSFDTSGAEPSGSATRVNRNSVALVRERIILTEGPPLVGEASANFLRIEGASWSA